MKRTVLIPVLSSIIIMFTLACNRGPTEREEAASRTVNVMTDTARLSPVVFAIAAPGTLSTETELKLSFKTGGVIANFPVSEGRILRKGDLIASLNLSEINSIVRQYELALDKATRDLNRVSNLYADSVTTLETLQNARTARDMAQSMLNSALFNRDMSVIIAPSDGKVLKKISEEGEIIAAGHPTVLFAPSDGGWVISSSVSDKNIIKIKTGDSTIIWLDAFPGTTFVGRVYETGSLADHFTGTYLVKIAITDADTRFRTGMTGRINIVPSEYEQHITIPLGVLTDTGDESAYIFMVDGDTYRKVRIGTGEIIRDRIVVRHGLSAGDVFITEGMSYLTPGCIISIINR
jgi:membrane fusion protein, multidrug efflux system